MTIKLITASLLLIPALSYCQTEATTKDGKKVILNKDMTWTYADCSALTETKTYAGGKVMTSSKENFRVSADGKNGIDISILKGTGTIIFNFASINQDVKCVNKDAAGTIEFTDGSKVDIKHMSDLNCKGNFSCFFGLAVGTETEAKAVQDKKIKRISLEYTKKENNTFVKYTEDFNVAAAQADRILKTIQCLSN
ncbi:hypothetical protein Q765_09230 [Flavobacterium rivuli WB 3.3-2 = DSM 21788]|uniref:Uncharacterized protein n=1 Tax=Flavobacterium rivuli WB 3.3-2 = DSM 21788 TaxID=1121895 RepID=A0A0A2M2D6_9FLAO|nr:hypothetical protein [Flavobacterium rivuli]KGO86797.1 hypothetical protein Q765_09230 [Flavobacterium rivuli WB 3.3-2 = DSM 21788]